TITRDLKSAISQVNNIMGDVTSVEFDKRDDRFALFFKKFRVTFDIEAKEKQDNIIVNNTKISTENFSEDEIRIYGGCDE
ncbi:MAG: hypothetical protein ACRC7S_19110, partial [Cetobacterium sp.]